MIGKIISHYKILDKLGEGGMGIVYKAQDTKLDRAVALKFLPQHLAADSVEKERFLHEARAASALNHPNITVIHEIDEYQGQVYLAMEHVEGQNLRQLVEREPITIKKVLDIALQICDGLAAAREKGVIHRDIKSENIMLTPKGQVKVMDFGLAKLKGTTKLTKAGTTLGTAVYMSPEQASGEEIDHRSDIFSFGVVLYELLTGQLPFKGEHQAAVVYSILNEDPQPVARYNKQVSNELERIVSKALAKDTEDRYQHIEDVQADLRRERKSLDYVRSGQIAVPPQAGKPKKKLLPFLIPASIVLVLVLSLLILQPFKVEIAPQQKALAEENSLAIMYFENVADPEDKDRIAQMITALLITDLSESQYMQVVSRQRLYDILKQIGKEELKVIDRTVASEVAQKAGVRWILTGSILQTEPNLVLTADISEAGSGEILATQRITGEPEEDLFAAVDRLSAEIKEDLALPEQAIAEPDRPVAEATTHSPQAYRYYLEGLDDFYKVYYPEAEKNFQKALELDSTFAMAYFWLAAIKRRGAESEVLIQKAVKYSDKISQKEKYYIKVLEAGLARKLDEATGWLEEIIGDYPEEKLAYFYLGIFNWNQSEYRNAIGHFKKAVEIDPYYKLVYNMMAYVYDEMGEFENSLWAINRYIELAPDEANPYDTRGDLYAYDGKIDQAIESYQEALEVKPDFHTSVEKLGHMHLFKRKYAQAKEYYQKLASSSQKDMRAEGRIYLALIPLYQGKFEHALSILDQGIAADKMEQAEGWQKASKSLMKARTYEEKKELDAALGELKRAMDILRKANPQNQVYGRDYYVRLLAQKGEMTKAEEVAQTLKSDIESNDTTQMRGYWNARGYLELAKGNTEASLANFQKVLTQSPGFSIRYNLAGANLQAGRLGEAVKEFEEILNRYDTGRAIRPIRAVKSHYLLGLAYEKSGWKQKAIEKYEEFLDIWKDADPGIEEVDQAKKRLAALKSKA
jgi:tetratricopeptide (TPR) repeat protein